MTGASSRTRRRVLVVAAVYAGALFLFGALVHTVPVAGGEADGYGRQAETLLAGEIPRDPFRPLGYVVAVAGVGAVAGDTWLAGIAVSSIAAALLALVAFGLGRGWGGDRAGWLAFGLTASSAPLVVHGVQVVTDVLFAAACGGVLLATRRCAARPGTGAAAILGLAFGAAWFVRYTAVALLPGAVLAALAPRGASPGRRWRRVLALGGGAVAALVPHFVLSTVVFGRPVYDENWRNLAFKFLGNWDGSTLLSDRWGGYGDVLAEAPGGILARGTADVLTCYAGPLQGLLAPPPASSWIGSALVLLAVWAVAGLLRRREPGTACLLVSVLLYPALVCFTFQPQHRMLLPVLPVYLAWTGTALLAPGRPRAALPAALALLVWNTVHLPRTIGDFADRHPHPEIAAARALLERDDAPRALLTSYARLRDFVAIPAIHLPRLPDDSRGDAAAVHQRLRSVARRTGTRWAVLGSASLPHPSWNAVRSAPWPDDFDVLRDDERVVVLELPAAPSGLIRRALVRPNPFTSGGDLELVLLTAPGTAVRRAGFDARFHDGGTMDVRLEPAGPGRFHRRLPGVRLDPGRHRLTPYLVLDDDSVVPGAPVELVVR